ncbi:MAG: DNA cytosine methyltransferase [Acidobacteriota bacterium]|nr:DNA cytosine methyltransferase [Acidobacteriota bacterium]
MKVVEFYSGIGGFSAALGNHPQVLAVDQSPPAVRVYRANFAHPVQEKTVESIDRDQLRNFGAHLWWASPPCQPFTYKGNRKQLDDHRAAGLPVFMEHLAAVQPPFFAMENVAGFLDSQGHRLVRQVLAAQGYRYIWERILCPTQLGIPNLRPRYFLVAGKQPLVHTTDPRPVRQVLSDFLQPNVADEFDVCPDLVERFRRAMDLIPEGETAKPAACFTSGYGKSIVRCGSYLIRSDGRIRYFTPDEAAALLGFPADFRFPDDLTNRQKWKLLGNSLSIPCVRKVLRCVPMGNCLNRC